MDFGVETCEFAAAGCDLSCAVTPGKNKVAVLMMRATKYDFMTKLYSTSHDSASHEKA
jgi:hypothetical protein